MHGVLFHLLPLVHLTEGAAAAALVQQVRLHLTGLFPRLLVLLLPHHVQRLRLTQAVHRLLLKNNQSQFTIWLYSYTEEMPIMSFSVHI